MMYIPEIIMCNKYSIIIFPIAFLPKIPSGSEKEKYYKHGKGDCILSNQPESSIFRDFQQCLRKGLQTAPGILPIPPMMEAIIPL